jgi:hypothetical protein
LVWQYTFLNNLLGKKHLLIKYELIRCNPDLHIHLLSAYLMWFFSSVLINRPIFLITISPKPFLIFLEQLKINFLWFGATMKDIINVDETIKN